jgi:hypothetical protein
MGGGEMPIQVVMQFSGVTWRVTRLLIDVPAFEALMEKGPSPMRDVDAPKTKP